MSTAARTGEGASMGGSMSFVDRRGLDWEREGIPEVSEERRDITDGNASFCGGDDGNSEVIRDKIGDVLAVFVGGMMSGGESTADSTVRMDAASSSSSSTRAPLTRTLSTYLHTYIRAGLDSARLSLTQLKPRGWK